MHIWLKYILHMHANTIIQPLYLLRCVRLCYPTRLKSCLGWLTKLIYH